MCKITNENTANILKTFRKIDNKETLTTEEIAETLAGCKVLEDEIKKYQTVLKAEAISRGIKKEVVSSYHKKVERMEGRSSTTFNMKGFINEMTELERTVDLYDVITIVKKRVEEKADPILTEIMENYSKSEKGSPFIQVSKLNKAEEAELLKS